MILKKEMQKSRLIIFLINLSEKLLPLSKATYTIIYITLAIKHV